MLSRVAPLSARVGGRWMASQAAASDLTFGFSLSEESKAYQDLARKFTAVCGDAALLAPRSMSPACVPLTRCVMCWRRST